MDLAPILDGGFQAHVFDSDWTDQNADVLKLDDAFNLGDSAAEGALDMDEENGIVGELPAAAATATDVELSPGGILDEETMSRGMSNLGCSANGCHQVYLDVTIPGFSLTDISLLSEYQHLQKVEIPYNDITDLSPLGKLKYLLFLDASHNKIEKLLDFEPPFNLQEVNMSWNRIQYMCNLSAHHFLKKLILDNNSISSIFGLQKCKNLKYLSLAHNNISDITGLDGLPIQHLNISNNKIKLLQNLESLTHLKKINLSGNCIRSLSGLHSNTMLESVDLEANEVLDVVEVQHIKCAKNLKELNLLRNPIQELPEYRLSILFRINRLTILDRHPVKEQEKVAAVNMFDPPREVIVASDHIVHVVYSFLQPSRVRDSTLPNIGTPYPMLVLVGPQGSGKRVLMANLLQEFGDYFGCGISHTTRQPWPDEVADEDYYFVSLESFEADIRRGEFIQTYDFSDHWYGLQMASVENVAREGLACVVHMELEGVLSLKRTFFEPRYVLIMPLDSEAHERRLRESGIYTEKHVDMVLKRADMYIKQNQNHPGFFDMMISSDNIAEAYTQLRKLVMDYLGISSPEAISNTHSDTEGQVTAAESPLAVTGRALSNLMRSSTWSRQSIAEHVSQQHSSCMGSQGIVEEESIKRRQGTAKDLVSGYVPTLTEQLMKKYPRTPSPRADVQTGLGETEEQRSCSAPTNQSGLETGHDETDVLTSGDSFSDTHSASCPFDLDSAPEERRVKGRKVNTNTNFTSVLPTQKVNPLDLIDEQSYQTTSNLPDACPLSASRHDSKYPVARPGSNRHAVLPPIQNIAAS